MSYIVPSVLVYQILKNAGGVLNSTPNLEACLVGACYNVVRYASGNTQAQAATLAASNVTFSSLQTLNVPSALPGQVYDTASVAVWVSQAKVTSLNLASGSNYSITANSPVVTITAAGTTVNDLTAAGTAKIRIGDQVVFTSGSTTFTSVVASIDTTGGKSFTLTDNIPATVTSASYSLNVVQSWNDIQLGGTYYSTTNLQTANQFTVNPSPVCSYGTITSGNIYLSYRALRTDIADEVLVMNNINDVNSTLVNVGSITEENPLALAAQIALANSGTSRVKVIPIQSDDLAGYQGALNIASNERVYALVPLTQDSSILSLFQNHVDNLSTPAMASWRVALLNYNVATSQTMISGGGSTASLTTQGVLTDTGLSGVAGTGFIASGVNPGDSISVVSGGSNLTLVVQNVLSNQSIQVSGTGITALSNVTYSVTRTLTRSQQADTIAKVAAKFNDHRVILVMPDKVGISISGVVKYLSGYYLCAGLAGMIAGFPVQQGFTNIGIAGIADIKHSNYYFAKEDLNTMSSAGVFLFVQSTPGGIPYVRHQLTTDISVLPYRELSKVKNNDFLSYYYHDKLTPFIGSWNITPDTLSTIRQTIVAASELLKSQKLPKIGAPLLSYNITQLVQDPNNTDNVDITLEVATGTPNNYTNLYLMI